MNKPAIDHLILGDNQFFGINHRSQERALEMARRFASIEAIMEVYEIAYGAGISAYMLNSNQRAEEICDRFRTGPWKGRETHWYPSVPYPHKYANLVAEFGIPGTLTKLLRQSDSVAQLMAQMVNGGLGLLTRDAPRLMKTLVDMELRTFRGLDVRVVFLQNIMTDLLVGLDLAELFIAFSDHVRSRFGAKTGLITQNLPALLASLEKWDLQDVVVCASINERGYLMSPGKDAYERLLAEPGKYPNPIMAMSVLAAGGIDPNQAFAYLGKNKVDSVVFGASRRESIRSTVDLVAKHQVIRGDT